MACWPANIVGAFFVVLLLVDATVGNYDDMSMHGITGVLMTLLFWFVCSILGEAVSGAVLAVPAVVVLIFMFSVWFVGKSIKNRGCCVTCSKKAPPRPAATASGASGSASQGQAPAKCVSTVIGGQKFNLNVTGV